MNLVLKAAAKVNYETKRKTHIDKDVPGPGTFVASLKLFKSL